NYGCDLARIRYLDIGANHPTFLSNTYLLYEAGARGILIEPNPDLAALLRAKRPRDVVINAGIAFDDRRTATPFRLTSPGFNTFSRAQAEPAVASSRNWAPADRQEIIDQIEVPLIPINEVIKQHATGDAPHVVSIDTEGCDLAILETLDLGLLNGDLSIPSLICIEASTSASEFLRVLEPVGFQLTARTPDNWIFRRHNQRLRLCDEG